MSLVKKTYRRVLSALLPALLCLVMTFPQGVAAAYTGQQTSVRLLDGIVGRYTLNYTGNTNHYAFWTMGATTSSNHIHNDTGGSYANSSTATLSKTTGARGIRYAFLVW